MDYKLAKRLKDAGYPEIKSGKVVMSDTQKKLFLHGGIVSNEGYCGVPTLSELIEACGDDFYSLYKEINGWSAYSTKFSTVNEKGITEIGHPSTGSTPEQAVARLYLALNKK